jgi:putative Mg2+ transporter-C (MgtC) family protein
MTANIETGQVALRLALTAVGAALIGFDRETNSRPAGLRTTLLVALAACFAMIQAEALMGLRGRTSDSFVSLDVMRLPLGILSGMGFIGAGAILRKSNGVEGVTTAATLWFVTVMGLCFGGGQISLGITAAILGVLILQGLRHFESRWRHDQKAILRLVVGSGGPGEGEISRLLKENGCLTTHWSASYSGGGVARTLTCDVHWRGRGSEWRLPDFLDDLARRKGVISLDWRREGGLKPE